MDQKHYEVVLGKALSMQQKCEYFRTLEEITYSYFFNFKTFTHDSGLILVAQ